MADGVEFDIKGLDSLLGKLAAVTYDLKRKGGRSALRATRLRRPAASAVRPRGGGASVASALTARWQPGRAQMASASRALARGRWFLLIF